MTIRAVTKVTLVLLFLFSMAFAIENLIATPTNVQAGPPIKLDKQLRRALLRALVDLEAESAEQHAREEEEVLLKKEEGVEEENPETEKPPSPTDLNVEKKDLTKDFGTVQKFAFDSFNGDQDLPSEDKLQNSTFIEIEKYVSSNDKFPDQGSKDKKLPDESQIESRSLDFLSKSFLPKKINDSQKLETLSVSASSGIASANSLVSPKPTVPSPTIAPSSNVSSKPGTKIRVDTAEDVKIFQAPLVAAFTVQQDEQGVPKSVVPIYRPTGDGKALTLQEQLEFKHKLLEKQLAELQLQQQQQAQFLIQQQQLYEQQLRQKQHQLYVQEQTKLKQLQEQTVRLKQIEEHKRLRQIEEQRFHQQLQQQITQQLQQQIQSNQLPTSGFKSNVHLQPSLTLELPKAATPPAFKLNFQELPSPTRNVQFRTSQSFPNFVQEFQPVVAAPTNTRFHRQEAFNSVGNFGINLDKSARNNFGFANQQRNPVFVNFNHFRQGRLPTTSTPAKQIQHLLFQSGIASDLRNAPGTSDQEDLNIVSKVLALNVGALPPNSLQFSGPSNVFRTPNLA